MKKSVSIPSLASDHRYWSFQSIQWKNVLNKTARTFICTALLFDLHPREIAPDGTAILMLPLVSELIQTPLLEWSTPHTSLCGNVAHFLRLDGARNSFKSFNAENQTNVPPQERCTQVLVQCVIVSWIPGLLKHNYAKRGDCARRFWACLPKSERAHGSMVMSVDCHVTRRSWGL